MFQWLKALLWRRRTPEPEPVLLRPLQDAADEPLNEPADAPVDESAVQVTDEAPRAAAAEASPEARGGAARGEEMCAFFGGLVTDQGGVRLHELPMDDRLFVSGVMKRVREEELEVPVLPQAALQISQLLSNPNSDARSFAAVLEADPALSVEVLRIANSAFYGFHERTASVRDAVVRIGLTQLRGLIMVTHLHGKVLQGGAYRQEAEWMVELSMGLAQLCQTLAAEMGLGRDEAFTRGVLSHLEHFIIMGSVADVAREQKKRIQPSRRALLDAIHLCGARVRDLAAQHYDLAGVMALGDEDGARAARLQELRRALVEYWSGAVSPPAVTGVDPQRLKTALQRLRG